MAVSTSFGQELVLPSVKAFFLRREICELFVYYWFWYFSFSVEGLHVSLPNISLLGFSELNVESVFGLKSQP